MTKSVIIHPYEEEIKKHGCEHIGKLHPREFQCIECEDTAEDCNCFDSAGVWCNGCNEIIWLDCEYIRWAWERKKYE